MKKIGSFRLMRRTMRKVTVIGFVLLAAAVCVLWHRNVRLRGERDRYRSNTEVLMSDMKRLRVDSAMMAVDVKGLRLNVEEYKRLRRGDAEKIKAMGGEIATSPSGSPP